VVQIDPRDAQNALDEGRMVAEELRVRLGLEGSKEFRVDEVPEVEAARLTMDLAEKNKDRAETLKKHVAIAMADVDQAQADYRAAVERYHLAKLQARQLYQSYRSAQTHLVTLQKAVDDCSICAPFDGWVAARCVSVGERVISLFPSGKLATVLRIDPLRLRLTVPQQETARIKVGQQVTFQVDAHAGRTFIGTVRYIAPAVDAENRSLCIEAVVPNPGAVLRPGLFVSAELQLDEERTEVFVPRVAVRQRGDSAAVFVVRDHVVREQIVSLGESEGARVRVTIGLAPGDVVVTTPESVRDGDVDP
jgi:RND family efflux transporter MFP subunit